MSEEKKNLHIVEYDKDGNKKEERVVKPEQYSTKRKLKEKLSMKEYNELVRKKLLEKGIDPSLLAGL